jgi:hypothetical protein
MKFSSATLAVALTALVSHTQALYFYIDGATPKCFYEDLPKGTLVVGESAQLWKQTLQALFPGSCRHARTITTLLDPGPHLIYKMQAHTAPKPLTRRHHLSWLPMS